MNKISIIIGGAGFIGSNLLSRLVLNSKVFVIDNLSRGSIDYIRNHTDTDAATFIEADVSKRSECLGAFSSIANSGEICDVWHLAANSDIPAGVNNADIDFKDTFQTTFEILHAMKAFEVKRLFFASTSAIYGDLGNCSLHENIGPLLPISNYGSMKLASEAIISSAAENFLDLACIFRFPNVVGAPATHGVIYDFLHKLKRNPSQLNVMGNGTQQKSYLHVSDLIDAMIHISSINFSSNLDVVNIGPLDEGVTVKFIAESVLEQLNFESKIFFGSENRGWVGDVPKFVYSTDKLQSYGWAPKFSSSEAIKKAIFEVANQLNNS